MKREHRPSYHSIERLRDDHLEEAVEILSEGLGSAYVSESELRELMRNGGYVLGDVAERDGRVMGAAGGKMMSENDRSFYAQYAGLKLKTPVGWMKSVVVRPDCRHREIGSELLRGLELALAPCRTYFSAAWDSRHGENAAGILRRYGYDMTLKVPKYWSEDEHGCPLCEVPCFCTAEFFVKHVKTSRVAARRDRG